MHICFVTSLVTVVKLKVKFRFHMVVMFVYIFHKITATKVVYFSEISYHKTGQCPLVAWCSGQIL